MKRIYHALSSRTAISTAIYYAVSFGLNVLRYLFHLILMRFLSPGEYGEFLSYLSLTYLIGIPTGTLGNIVTKYVSEFRGKSDLTSINQFFYFILKSVFPITTILALLMVVFSQHLATFFKASPLAFMVLGVSLFISIFSTLISSYLVAFQRFIFQSFVGLLSVILNMILAVVFINLHLSATGAVLAQLVTGIITTLIIFFAIKPSIIPQDKSTKKFSLNLFEFTGFSFIFSLGTMSLLSTDVLVVRALVDQHISGVYSSLSILGRMILFGLLPISALILPLATHRFSATGDASKIFGKLLLAMFTLGMIGVSIFGLFPELIVGLLSGQAYLSAASFLPPFALSMFFFALKNLPQYLIYLLNRDKFKHDGNLVDKVNAAYEQCMTGGRVYHREPGSLSSSTTLAKEV